MDKRIILLLGLAAVFFFGAPITSILFFWTTAESATVVDASATGLLICLGMALLGVCSLALAAIASHLIGDPHQPAATDSISGAEDGASRMKPILNAAYGPIATAERRKTPISRSQWHSIHEWSLVDDDVRAIAERYETGDYEVVDDLPGTTTADGRYVSDIAVEFMYPAGARAVLGASKRATNGELVVLSPE